MFLLKATAAHCVGVMMREGLFKLQSILSDVDPRNEATPVLSYLETSQIIPHALLKHHNRSFYQKKIIWGVSKLPLVPKVAELEGVHCTGSHRHQRELAVHNYFFRKKEKPTTSALGYIL